MLLLWSFSSCTCSDVESLSWWIVSLKSASHQRTLHLQKINEVQPTFGAGLKSSLSPETRLLARGHFSISLWWWKYNLFQSFLTVFLCVVILCFPCWWLTDRLCFYSLAKVPISPVSLIQFIRVAALVPVINHWNAFVETKKWTWTDLKPVSKNRRSNEHCDWRKVWKKLITVNESLIAGGEITSHEGWTEEICCVVTLTQRRGAPEDLLRGRSLTGL